MNDKEQTIFKKRKKHYEKQNSNVKSLFDKLVFIRNIPYWVFWICIGLFIFAFGRYLISYLNEKHFIITQILFCGAIGTLPIINITLHKYFKRIVQNLDQLFELKDKTWIKNEEIKIFTLKTMYAKFIVFFITLSATFTILYLRIPYQSTILQIFSLFNFIILAFFCGITLQISISLLIFLRKISNLRVICPFYKYPHPPLDKLQNYYSFSSMIILLYYIGSGFSVWFGPYGINTAMLVWLSALALYPISLFSWSYFHIRLIRQRIKFSFISVINNQVNCYYNLSIKEDDEANIDKLIKFMKIQSDIQNLKVHKSDLGGIITFISAFIAAVVQILIVIKSFVN